jgi:hypothetical protein
MAALALIVLVVLIAVFTGQSRKAVNNISPIQNYIGDVEAMFGIMRAIPPHFMMQVGL